VRELEHTISRAALKAAAGGTGSDRIVTIEPSHLDLAKPRLDETAQALRRDEPMNAERISLAAASAKFQRELIERTLLTQRGNWAAAARELELDRGNLRRLAKRLGISGS
jgi:anaerobic nitric oxide reductase transcription regulator